MQNGISAWRAVVNKLKFANLSRCKSLSIATSVSIPTDQNICNHPKFAVRHASNDDMWEIKKINEACLPENYTYDSYIQQFRFWPELCLVCETCDTADGKAVVGYALGQVQQISTSNKYGQEQFSGHLQSIAVLPFARGVGAGAKLLTMLHEQMRAHYAAREISLHCRVSNTAGINFYAKYFNYAIESRLPMYYQDGEDAFLMKKLLE